MTKIYEAVFYKSNIGKEPVREWLLDLERNDKKIIGSDIRVVEFSGELKPPRVKKIETGLWEVRSHLSSDKIARVLYPKKRQNDTFARLYQKESKALTARQASRHQAIKKFGRLK